MAGRLTIPDPLAMGETFVCQRAWQRIRSRAMGKRGPGHRPAPGTAFTELAGLGAQRAERGEKVAEARRCVPDRRLADAVAAHHGTVAKSVGDGIRAIFLGAVDAVAAAARYGVAAEIVREPGRTELTR